MTGRRDHLHPAAALGAPEERAQARRELRRRFHLDHSERGAILVSLSQQCDWLVSQAGYITLAVHHAVFTADSRLCQSDGPLLPVCQMRRTGTAWCILQGKRIESLWNRT